MSTERPGLLARLRSASLFARHEEEFRPIWCETLEGRTLFTDFHHTDIVTNANDSGPGSLRQAIITANAADVNVKNFSTIQFEIRVVPRTTAVIAPKTALPALTRGITISGATEQTAVAAGIPHVAIVGFSAGKINGLTIAGADTVSGLSLAGFKLNGILITGGGFAVVSSCSLPANGNDGILVKSSHDTISNNRVGTSVDGASAAGNKANGIEVSAPDNTLTGNLASGNYLDGILLNPSADHTVVVKNYVGTNLAGTAAIPNMTHVPKVQTTFYGALEVNSSHNTIGKTGQGNLVSGNAGFGIDIIEPINSNLSLLPTGNLVQGNTCGTNLAGTAALPNTLGIDAEGGNTTIDGNLISGNSQDGIFGGTDGDVITSNIIGADRTISKPLGNGFDGIECVGAGNCTIGKVGAGNYICSNGGDGINVVGTGKSITGNFIGVGAKGVSLGNKGSGVNVDSQNELTPTYGNPVLSNSIYANKGGGILDNLYSDPNRPPSNLPFSIAPPVLTNASTKTGITGTLAGSTNSKYTIQFFSNPINTTQGLTFLGSITVTTNKTGFASFTDKSTIGVLLLDITATATDAAGNTSKFSKAIIGV